MSRQSCVSMVGWVLSPSKRESKVHDHYRLGQVQSFFHYSRLSLGLHICMSVSSFYPQRIAVMCSVVHKVLNVSTDKVFLLGGQILGKGAFGIVYLATDLADSRQYACKSINKAKLVTEVAFCLIF